MKQRGHCPGIRYSAQMPLLDEPRRAGRIGPGGTIQDEPMGNVRTRTRPL
jgi:hypothetical protein